eukprot:GDKI01020247.1.p1 GENE.GDKI01020247.1~~GDKI01020247.1.p1  ORF type:complete len:465 (+),score=103.93 GDKI01020247.1:84-1478(+)
MWNFLFRSGDRTKKDQYTPPEDQANRSSSSSSNGPNEEPQQQPEESVDWRQVAVKTGLVMGVGLLGAVLWNLRSENVKEKIQQVSFTLLEQMLSSSKVKAVTFHGDAVFFSDKENNRYVTGLVPGSENFLFELIKKHSPRLESVPIHGKNRINPVTLMVDVASLLITAGGLMWILNEKGFFGAKFSGKRLDKSSKSRQRASKRLTFRDVAGNEKTKAELAQVIDFLRNPEEFSALGARVPRGILLEGPSGTGKTLLARAAAGEAGVPFFYATASSFVEVYVGQGASRVREFFASARENAPCIVFIDELDALGPERRSLGQSSQEYVQTLNQLLAEMDGMERDTQENGHLVVVMAATNRYDVLDEALTRPGRFDRLVTVGLPGPVERAEICRIHCENKRIAPTVSLSHLAEATDGFSGAELESLLNEAALLAAREGSREISVHHIKCVLETFVKRKMRRALPHMV